MLLRTLTLSIVLPAFTFFALSGAASATDRTWVGGAPALSTNWNAAANWDGLPVAGDKLIFPAGAPRRTNNNNFAANTAFSGIVLGGLGCASGTNCNYVLGGNEINLGLFGITATVASGTLPIINLPITLSSGSSIASNSANPSPLTINGAINLNGQSLTLQAVSGASLLINGDITGAGALSTASVGRVTLTGAGVSTAPMNSAATLVADGTGSMPVAISGSGTLRGSGQVGAITVSGTQNKSITPGSGAGNTGTGILNGGSDVTMSPSTTLNITLNGTTAGTDYSRLRGLNTDINGANLALTLGFVPPIGTQFHIVFGSTSTNGSLTGQFSQGANIIADGIPFSIAYGVTGVTLTVLPPPATTATWTGAGADNNWTTAANWAGNVAPSADFDLVFPESAARKTHTNNFPAGTSFKSIALNGTAYAISGNAIVLTGGITANHVIGLTPKLQLGVTLAAAQTFAHGAGAFNFEGPLNLNGFALTVDAPGPNLPAISGVVSGAGGLVKTGTAQLILSGNNAYSGVTQILAGVIGVNHPNALGATGAGNHTVVSTGAQLLIGQDVSGTAEALTLSGDGSASNGALAFGGTSGITAQSLTGVVTLAADSSIGLASTSGGAALMAPINEIGGARKLTIFGSSGKLLLPAANTFSGGTLMTASGGNVQVDGSLGAVTMGTATADGGSLSGSGTVAAFTLVTTPNPSLRVRPGSDTGPGILTVSGNAVLHPQAAFDIRIAGTTLGSQYSQLSVGGTVALAGVTLAVSQSVTPTVGNTFTIIQSTGTISGQFAQGASVTVGPTVYGITYNANSVVLTVLPPAQTLTVTRRGSGAGTVVSAPAGISCGAVCTAPFASGAAVTLTATPPSGSVFTGWLGACTGSANCVFSIGSSNTVSATFALNTVVTNNRILDIDANNAYDDSTDGLLIMRFLQGRTGFALTTGALGPSPGRSDPTNYLNDVLPYLDADGNGVVDPLTDGLLIIRHLLGFTGSALTQNALGAGATRNAGQITTYLNGLKP